MDNIQELLALNTKYTALVRAAVRVVVLDDAEVLEQSAIEALRAAITDVEPQAFDETEGGE